MSTSCKCPQKNSQKFLNKISDWCARAETCLDDGTSSSNNDDSNSSGNTARMNSLNEESSNHGSGDDNDDDNIWNKKSDRYTKWLSHRKRKSSMLFKLGLVGLLLGIIAIRYVISLIGCCKDDDNDKEGDDETTLASATGRNSGTTGNNVMNDDDDDKTEAMSVVSDRNE